METELTPPYTKEAKDTKDAHGIHVRAEQARESGQTTQALDLYAQAIGMYKVSDNMSGVAEAFLGKSIALRHLFQASRSHTDGESVLEAITTSSSLVEEHNIVTLRPVVNFQWGSFDMMKGDYTAAVDHFQIAYESHIGTQADKANYLSHLGFAQYKKGEKTVGLQHLEEGANGIVEHALEVDDQTARTWNSGALMRLTEAWWDEGDKTKALEYLHEAEEVIVKEPKLLKREEQIADLKKRLGIA